MSSGVSQINFWQQEPPKSVKEVLNKDEQQKEGGEGGTFLSYDVFLGLAVLGGFFALDHLYLRSPMTFLAKFIVNILGLGVWWLYDASQAYFNKDVVKVFGLPVPGLGAKGIGAGVMAADKPDKKHLSFLFYGLALFFGGIIGLDSFLTGDKQSGIIRLISFITVIFAPVAIAWWAFNVFKFVFNTKKVVETNWAYFGAPPPISPEAGAIDKLIMSIPILNKILGPIKPVLNTVEAVAADPNVLLKGPLGKTIETAAQAASPVVTPVTAAVKSAADAVSGVAAAAKSSLNLAKTTVETGAQIGQEVANTLGPLAKLAEQGATLHAKLTEGAISAAASKALRQQEGGANDSNTLGYILLSVFGLIAVSGFAVTYLRTKKNGKPQRDDAPPEPGVL